MDSRDSQKISISLEVCLQIFPIVICLDNDGSILYLSERASAYLDSEYIGRSIFDYFDIGGSGARVEIRHSFEDSKPKDLFLLHSDELGVAFRGQVVRGMYDSKIVSIFVGAPWINWYYGKNKPPKFSRSDFPAVDTQLELEMNICSTNEMLSDAREYSEKLQRLKVKSERANLSKSEFVRHISHELRTPLNGVITSLQLLKSERNADKHKRLIEIANISSKVLMNIINEVLDFSSLEAGVNGDETATLEIKSFINQIGDSFLALAVSKNQQLQFHISPLLPKFVRLNKLTLHKVLNNLIGNAIKYSGSGDIVSRLRSITRKGTQYLEVVVEDSGKGIQGIEGGLEHIFEPFWVSDVADSTEPRTGLGLYIVKKMIEDAGGEIVVESQLGEGAKFTFTLPMSNVRLENIQKDENKKDGKDNIRFKGSVLVVDDNSINLELAHLMLSNLGLSTTIANGGAEAIAICDEADFDLIFMDIEMPVINGMEVTENILRGNRNPDTPIVAMTANVSEDDIEKYLSCGMKDVLTKPVVNNELHIILSKYLTLSDALETDGGSVADCPREDQLDSPLLHFEILGDLAADIGAQNVFRIVDLYIEETAPKITELAELLKSGKTEESAKLAHRMASSTLSFGLIRLGETLRKIEKSPQDYISVNHESIEGIIPMFSASKDVILNACKSKQSI